MADSALMDISAARLRALRAALFTALCVLLSAASHVLLSGRALPAAAVAGAGAGVFALAYALAGRERGYGRIAALLVPLQLAVGALFAAGQDGCYGRPGHPAPGALTWLCSGTMGTPLARWADPGAAPWLLLAGHVALGLLAAAWLRRGEAALGRLLRAAAAAAFRPLRMATTDTARVRPRRGPLPRPVRDGRPARPLPLLVHSVVRRGPPPGPALAA
ncbi:hypothetical protein [Streptomyces griseocarneus]|uniref:hypothetical protein n=1 Tax=Streptomyces griseocarneus TaxID=51201 RepID=UPI001CCDFFB9|nr:hypothetical protein [Streptomyces griseocarneus]MBZ6471962.1 hypothetical protein [Streptomyces griseocarneus]